MKAIIENSLKNALNYTDYKKLVEQLILENSTTGEWTEDRMNFTKLNFSRMKRMDSKIEVLEKEAKVFQNLGQKQYWFVMLESWCGDGAQTIPVLNKLAENSENIDLKIILRDGNLEMMDLFLTDGSRSIPKLIITNENFEVFTTWGPRSKAAAKIVGDYKKVHGKVDNQIKTELQVWYNRDKGVNIISELVKIELQIIDRLALEV